MNTFIKYNNLAFAIIFLMVAIAEFAGFLGGRPWCGWAAIVTAIFSLLMFSEYRKSKNTNRA